MIYQWMEQFELVERGRRFRHIADAFDPDSALGRRMRRPPWLDYASRRPVRVFVGRPR